MPSSPSALGLLVVSLFATGLFACEAANGRTVAEGLSQPAPAVAAGGDSPHAHDDGGDDEDGVGDGNDDESTLTCGDDQDASADDDEFGGGCGSQLAGAPPEDPFRSLVHGDSEERGRAALDILRNRSCHSGAVVRRAIVVVASDPYCPQIVPLTNTLKDRDMDEPTRATAALALGTIARDFPCTFPSGNCPAPHDPIPKPSKKALSKCLEDAPASVQRACAEALGYVTGTELAPLMELRDDSAADSLVRVFAGRALTRLTGAPSITAESLNQVIQDAERIGDP